MELTETHLTLLRAAAIRADGMLQVPDRLLGAARRRMADRLLAAETAVTVPAADGQPHWFKDADGARIGLRITEAGRALVTINAEGSAEPSRADHGGAPPAAGDAGQGRAHRSGTKRALLLNLLGREGGATLADLTAATDWQPHTVRAALTRLRQDGVMIDRRADEGGTTYLIRHNTAADAPSSVEARA